ncbi:MAG TPA: D-alanyl-D-alanine carboxypeptidase family protein [Chloroflexota bacterium]|jgi:D-alanyl-D-alanine carboxypeptidase|nr:D-alanyl-D-alanine carboxypeptidase family protein [Chloroflexota bacterium]
MHRTWYIAPLVFVVLSTIGLQNVIARWMEPSAAVMPAKSVGAVAAMPLLAVPTAAGDGSDSPTATVAPTTTATPATLVIAAPRVADPGGLAFRPAATPNPSPNPTPAPPTRTPTVSPLDVAPPPRKTGSDPLPKFGAKEVVIIDGGSGAVLFEQAAHQRVAPASTTKIVTALVALERGGWSELVTARFDQSELGDSTLMGLRPGEQITIEDLLYGLMLPSGNDAALAVAEHVGGSKAGFAELMNQKAAELGLPDSHFVNPHGLDAPGHYSSAWDMVQFARHGMRDPHFQALAAARSRTVRVGGRTYEIPNLNRVLGQVPGADGVKIGYTEDAGRTIVASATRNGHRVYIGAFHSTDLVADCKPLFEWVFKNYTWAA